MKTAEIIRRLRSALTRTRDELDQDRRAYLRRDDGTRQAALELSAHALSLPAVGDDEPTTRQIGDAPPNAEILVWVPKLETWAIGRFVQTFATWQITSHLLEGDCTTKEDPELWPTHWLPMPDAPTEPSP